MFSRVDQGEVQCALLKKDRLLREQEVSEMGLAIATLQAWRRVGKPPAFIRLGRGRTISAVRLRELIRQGGYANRPRGGQDAC